jgi:hypothetical protein
MAGAGTGHALGDFQALDPPFEGHPLGRAPGQPESAIIARPAIAAATPAIVSGRRVCQPRMPGAHPHGLAALLYPVYPARGSNHPAPTGGTGGILPGQAAQDAHRCGQARNGIETFIVVRHGCWTGRRSALASAAVRSFPGGCLACLSARPASWMCAADSGLAPAGLMGCSGRPGQRGQEPQGAIGMPLVSRRPGPGSQRSRRGPSRPVSGRWRLRAPSGTRFREAGRT